MERSGLIGEKLDDWRVLLIMIYSGVYLGEIRVKTLIQIFAPST